MDQTLYPNPLLIENKRRIKRWPITCDVVYTISNHSPKQFSTTRDLTGRGACVYMEDAVEVNDIISFKILLPNNRPIEVRGRVLWFKRTLTEGQMVGVFFDDIDSASQDIILQTIYDDDRSALIDYWFKGC